jgi:hypothetical protein
VEEKGCLVIALGRICYSKTGLGYSNLGIPYPVLVIRRVGYLVWIGSYSNLVHSEDILSWIRRKKKKKKKVKNGADAGGKKKKKKKKSKKVENGVDSRKEKEEKRNEKE